MQEASAVGKRILLSVVACAVACAQQDDVVAPARQPDLRASVTEQPFYYYFNTILRLAPDSSVLVVAGYDMSAARVGEISRASGVASDSIQNMPETEHVAVYTAPVAGAAAAVVGAMRAHPNLRFIDVAYRTLNDGKRILPVNRIVVQFNAAASDEAIRALIDSIGMKVARNPSKEVGPRTYWLSSPSADVRPPIEVATRLYHHPLIAWCEGDWIGERRIAFAPNDSYYSQQFYLRNSYVFPGNGVRVDIDAERAWDVTTGSAGVRVAVLDEGIDGGHPDLGPKLVGGYDVFSVPGEDAYNPCLTCTGDSPWGGDAHGTAVASIVGAFTNNAAGVAGVAPNVSLLSVRVLRNGAGASNANIAAGLNWAWNTAAADVLNNSWGGGAPSEAISRAVGDAATLGRGGRGAVVVFSAGNDANNPSQSHAVSYPASLSASYSGVIAVSAMDRYGELSLYSNTGPEITVSAPSSGFISDVTTADLVGSPGYSGGGNPGDANYTTAFGGTSAAAPQVSGVAALLISREGALVSPDIRQRIRKGADLWGDASSFGAGKLNAYGALNSILVWIGGPTSIRFSGNHTWTATAQGGLGGSYAYSWLRDDGGGYYQVSTSSTYSAYVAYTDQPFDLKVVVTSGPSIGASEPRRIVPLGCCQQ